MTGLGGAQVAVLLDQPLGIVALDELADGILRFVDVAGDTPMGDLLLNLLSKRITGCLALELLGEHEALALVRRADVAAVEPVGNVGEPLVDQPAHDLAVLDDEGHLVRAHLKHRARPRPAGVGVAEAGIEEPGVMDAELAARVGGKPAAKGEGGGA